MAMPGTMPDDQSPPPADGVPNAAALATENALLRDRMLRALADAENTRRLARRAAEAAGNFAVSDFAREILVVADNLRRAIAATQDHAADSGGGSSLIEGVRATERILASPLERVGIRRIEALGARFDPNLHEAIMEIDDPSLEPGTVARVIEDGYMIGDRLLRPARVVVTKRDADLYSASNEASPDLVGQRRSASRGAR
jgi:molecular chaperone GrpE